MLLRSYHHCQVGPNLSEIVFQCCHIRRGFQLRFWAQPKATRIKRLQLARASQEPEVLVDPFNTSVVFQLWHPVQGTPTCPVRYSECLNYTEDSNICISRNLPDSIWAGVIGGSSGEIRCNNSPKSVTGRADGGAIRKLSNYIHCNMTR